MSRPSKTGRLVALPSPRCCPWLLELLRLHLWPELPFVFTWLILHYPLKISLVRRSFRKPFLPLSHRPLVKAAPGAGILLPGRSAHCSTTDPTTLLRVAPEVRLPPPPPARLNSARKESVLFIFYSQCLRIADSSRCLLIEQISTNSNRVTLEQRYQQMCTRTDAYTSRPRSELCALRKPARLGLRCAALRTHRRRAARGEGRPRIRGPKQALVHSVSSRSVFSGLSPALGFLTHL